MTVVFLPWNMPPSQWYDMFLYLAIFILPAHPLSDVLNKLPTVAGLLDSGGHMRCNDESINFKGSNLPRGQVIPPVQSIMAGLAFA